MTTIRDVAEKAGVATMTVSRVINDSGYVSEETRAKVEAAILELGYVPNMLGPSLRFNQTKTLALIITDITNPFWTTVARGAEDAAREEQYNVILCNTDESAEKQDQYVDMLLKRRTDGILLVPASDSPEAVKLMRSQDVAVVILDRRLSDVDSIDSVRSDSFGGAYTLARHLTDLGHEHIAILSGPRNISTSVERVEGFTQAMLDAGLPHNLERVFWGEYNESIGFDSAWRALRQEPRPTALLAANNFIANGALRALAQAGLTVPADVSIVSFDDFPENINPSPFLTVVAQPAYEMGYRAAQLLLARLAGNGSEDFQEIILPTTLVMRKSTAPPKSAGVWTASSVL
ncbi:MAG: LacI family DNA-binding transcriptional regulator [Candidatus Promineifilaceae bacterium]